VAAELATELPDDPVLAEAILSAAVDERVRSSGKTNVSRAVGDLLRAGLVRRHYAGWRTNHQNRGGQRSVVYTVEADALAALRRRSTLV
jgi:predicted transcriptional regulator